MVVRVCVREKTRTIYTDDDYTRYITRSIHTSQPRMFVHTDCLPLSCARKKEENIVAFERIDMKMIIIMYMYCVCSAKWQFKCIYTRTYTTHLYAPHVHTPTSNPLVIAVSHCLSHSTHKHTSIHRVRFVYAVVSANTREKTPSFQAVLYLV